MSVSLGNNKQTTWTELSTTKMLRFSHSGPFSVCRSNGSSRDHQTGPNPQTQTGDVGTSTRPSAPPEISGADVKLSISVSECGLILGRHCEMAEDLDHRAGRPAHTGHSRSINHGPLVRPWSAGATTSPSIHAAALRVLMLAMLRSACSAPPAVMASVRRPRNHGTADAKD